jgi:hypothetical protein
VDTMRDKSRDITSKSRDVDGLNTYQSCGMSYLFPSLMLEKPK